MKKITLSLLIVMVAIVVLGISIASADISGVNFVTPVVGDNISGNSYLINWTNTNAWGGLYLAYKAGGCQAAGSWVSLSGPFNPGDTEYTWDTSSLSDGIYCVRLDQLSNETYSGNITLDNANPVASLGAGEPYLCDEGDVINLDASNSNDAGTGVATYAWDTDNDGQYDDGTGVVNAYTCGDGPALPTVRVKVTDFAGNSAVASSTVNISNVPPVCIGIISFTDFAVGEPTVLDENASDVVDSLEYEWDFDDGTPNYLGDSVNHTFASAGIYNITVLVNDGTDACMNATTVTVVDPTVLTAQEVMALNNLDANFTPDEGAVPNSFATGLTGGVACTKRITEPSTMNIVGSGGDDCVVTWLAAANSYNGVNPMVVRVNNATDYKYFTFDTTVWSWKINLAQGWNLFSIPTVPEDSDVDSVIFDQLSGSLAGGSEYVLWSYQSEDGSGGSWLKSRKDSYGNLDIIEPGKAYWINMSSSAILYGYGDKLIAGSSPPESTISDGWNLIGHYGLLNTVLAQDALTSLVGYYSTVLDSDGDPLNVTADTFVPGEGYWVSTNLKNGEEVKYTPSSDAYNFN